MPLTPTQHERLNTLIMGNEGELDDPKDPFAGATLTVYPIGGTEPSFHEPLARMWRHELDENTIWLRPVITHPTERLSSTHYFGLATNRRRALSYTSVTETEHGLRFENVDIGIVGFVEPIVTVNDRRLAERLVQWDTFTLTMLPNETVSAITDLTEDSWHGDWA
jgi:hypothetical protein